MRKTTAAIATAIGLSVGMAAPAVAATLENGNNQACDGTGTWHFVNNQTGGAAGGVIFATFSINGGTVTIDEVASSVNRNTQHFFVTTDGDAVLLSAETETLGGDPLPGRLVLSDFECDEDGKKS